MTSHNNRFNFPILLTAAGFIMLRRYDFFTNTCIARMTSKMSQVPGNFKCREAWRRVVIDNRGRYRLCCISKLNIETDVVEFGHVESMTISAHMHSKKMNAIRTAMEQSQSSVEKPALYDDQCRTCLDLEAIGSKSRRQFQDMEFGAWDSTQVFPERIHFELGNLCNLKCRMCTQEFSSEIAKEYRDLGWIGSDTPYSPQGLLPSYDLNEKFFLDLRENLGTVKRIKFTGGEPLIHPLFRKIVRTIDESHTLDATPNLVIELITNLHSVPWDWIESYRGPLEVFVSLEALGERGEYIRRGSNFTRFEKNLERLLKFSHVKVGAYITLQALNMEFVPETYNYLRGKGVSNIGANLLCLPDFLSARMIPDCAKPRIKAKIDTWLNSPDAPVKFFSLRSALNLMMSPCPAGLRQKFINFNRTLDSRNPFGPQFDDLYPDYRLTETNIARPSSSR